MHLGWVLPTLSPHSPLSTDRTLPTPEGPPNHPTRPHTPLTAHPGRPVQTLIAYVESLNPEAVSTALQALVLCPRPGAASRIVEAVQVRCSRRRRRRRRRRRWWEVKSGKRAVGREARSLGLLLAAPTSRPYLPRLCLRSHARM
jgi:hypothetical protein